MQGKKHSKVEHLASIFNAAGADFGRKYRRNADFEQVLKCGQKSVCFYKRFFISCKTFKYIDNYFHRYLT